MEAPPPLIHDGISDGDGGTSVVPSNALVAPLQPNAVPLSMGGRSN